MLTVEQQQSLENLFTHHPVLPGQAERYQAIRDAGKLLATTIMLNTPPCPDQTAAIRKVREGVMTANAAIACNEK